MNEQDTQKNGDRDRETSGEGGNKINKHTQPAITNNALPTIYNRAVIDSSTARLFRSV